MRATTRRADAARRRAPPAARPPPLRTPTAATRGLCARVQSGYELHGLYEDPLLALRVAGVGARITRNDAAYYAAERESTLVKWNDRDDTLIDRFDGARARPHPARPAAVEGRLSTLAAAAAAARMLMDFIREPVPGRPAPKLPDELQHEETRSNYERHAPPPSPRLPPPSCETRRMRGRPALAATVTSSRCSARATRTMRAA